DDRVDLGLGHELGEGDAAHRAVLDHRHHVVAVAAQHEGPHVAHRHAELLGHEVAEPAGVEHPGHPHHVALGAAGDLEHRVHHRVERVADHDDEGVGAGRLQVGGDVRHDLDVGVQQVVAAHARLAGDAGGDDHHVGPGHVVVRAGADDTAVE